MSKHPVVENAPGLVWRPLKDGWQVRWQARTNLIRRGYVPQSVRLWAGPESDLTDTMVAFIQDRANALQDEMLAWGRGGVPIASKYDGTLGSLIRCYQTDEDSAYRKLRYGTRRNYDAICNRLHEEHGAEPVSEIKGRTLRQWHRQWSEGGKVAMAHTMVGMLRTLVGFGLSILECEHCTKLATVMGEMRFEMGKPRSSILTAEQADLIRAKAHDLHLPSMALAQAFQFELMLRQRDVIGEWVPMSEPGASEVTYGNEKWLRGLRWSEIDENLILRHVTSKRQKLIEVDLKLAPMVMQELELSYPGSIRWDDVTKQWLANRSCLPSTGPVILFEVTALPYTAVNYRRRWREMATMCGIPKTVRNMDSRAGAITEATDAGAELEDARHAATHSDISMTQRYSRGAVEKVARVMQKRAQYRNKTGN